MVSWSDVYPSLTDEQVIQYGRGADPDQLSTLDEWFSVSRTINEKGGVHLVSASLFWKNASDEDGELPVPSRELMLDAGKHGLITRYAPWEHYVKPLLEGAALLQKVRPDVTFRVYLAADLDFLIDELVEAGCEIKLMKGSSIRHNPGAMWRFLALGEENRWVTVTDADRARHVLYDIERTELTLRSGLCMWRVPYLAGAVKTGLPGNYRPIIASNFGAAGGMMDIPLLMRAFLWHTKCGTMPNRCAPHQWDTGGSSTPIYGTDWPTYGFDEWFLIAVVYPRIAPGGVLTFLSNVDSTVPPWFALDIEYVTWANRNSEMLFFDDGGKLDSARFSPEDTGADETADLHIDSERESRFVTMNGGGR